MRCSSLVIIASSSECSGERQHATTGTPYIASSTPPAVPMMKGANQQSHRARLNQTGQSENQAADSQTDSDESLVSAKTTGP
jgi:hypothetical protein